MSTVVDPNHRFGTWRFRRSRACSLSPPRLLAMQRSKPNKNHWSECGRAASVSNSYPLGRPHRSVPPFVISTIRCVTLNEYEHEEPRTSLSGAEQLDRKRVV